MTRNTDAILYLWHQIIPMEPYSLWNLHLQHWKHWKGTEGMPDRTAQSSPHMSGHWCTHTGWRWQCCPQTCPAYEGHFQNICEAFHTHRNIVSKALLNSPLLRSPLDSASSQMSRRMQDLPGKPNLRKNRMDREYFYETYFKSISSTVWKILLCSSSRRFLLPWKKEVMLGRS